MIFKILTLLKNSEFECKINVKKIDKIIKEENLSLKINPKDRGNNKNF